MTWNFTFFTSVVFITALGDLISHKCCIYIHKAEDKRKSYMQGLKGSFSFNITILPTL